MALEQAVKVIDVAAGLLLRADGSLLLGNRPAGKPYEGWWELPGGKLEPGETPLQALARELDEELGIRVTQATPWVTHVHAYAHATVRLVFCRVTGWEGEPRGREGQQLRWVDPALAVEQIEAGLGGGQLLPATLPPMAWLQVPTTYAIAGVSDAQSFLARVSAALERGVRLFQFRAPAWPQGPAAESLHEILCRMLALTRAAGARVLVNSVHPAQWWGQADGVHLRSTELSAATGDLPGHCWIGASAHNARELDQARAAGARFAVLGPVLPTASHPDAQPLGWTAFAELAANAGLPVFALGGQSPDMLKQAFSHGAHGIAGIRHLFEEDQNVT